MNKEHADDVGPAIRITGVMAETGLGRSSIFLKTNASSKYFDSTFPRSFPIGLRARAWSLPAIRAWVAAQSTKLEKEDLLMRIPNKHAKLIAEIDTVEAENSQQTSISRN